MNRYEKLDTTDKRKEGGQLGLCELHQVHANKGRIKQLYTLGKVLRSLWRSVGFHVVSNPRTYAHESLEASTYTVEPTSLICMQWLFNAFGLSFGEKSLQ